MVLQSSFLGDKLQTSKFSKLGVQVREGTPTPCLLHIIIFSLSYTDQASLLSWNKIDIWCSKLPPRSDLDKAKAAPVSFQGSSEFNLVERTICGFCRMVQRLWWGQRASKPRRPWREPRRQSKEPPRPCKARPRLFKDRQTRLSKGQHSHSQEVVQGKQSGSCLPSKESLVGELIMCKPQRPWPQFAKIQHKL